VNRLGYTKTDNKIIDNRKNAKTVTVPSRATLPKENRCGADEAPLERVRAELILLKNFLIVPMTFCVVFVLLLGCLLRAFGTLAGDILCGLMAKCLVRYIQLETSTSITVRGRR